MRRLAERNRQRRSRRAVAASTISWGEPILASAITRIEGGRLEYRGHDAIALSATATLEDVAALLWQVDALPQRRSGAAGKAWPRARASPARPSAASRRWRTWQWRAAGRDRVEACCRTPSASSIASPGRRRAASGTAVQASSLPLHERLASAWGVGPKAADLIRRALVLTADHELNVSTYAARVVASTRAPLGACILAGLAALVGPLHGGMTNEVRAMLADPSVAADPEGAIAIRLARGERIPGFGHPLYPDGDPRAAALLRRLPPSPHAPAPDRGHAGDDRHRARTSTLRCWCWRSGCACRAARRSRCSLSGERSAGSPMRWSSGATAR